MSYHLLTGSTGLLGTYLLRDNLCAGRQMALVVRSGIVEKARSRIESIMARWERELGRALPRPPVLEADLCQPDLGLSPADVEWVARNCVSVLHNAASLSFEANERTGEPYRSNVEGTRNVLELCRKTGIRQFHHVSTAYVCGLRVGCVFENELDVGQQSGNDYEKSKIQAETMVREAKFLDSTTIYRPAIIIGDSVTGYTTTYHGFYTPLKIGQALVDQMHISEICGEPLMDAMGMTGVEHKSLVPVDWVSRIITYLFGRPEHHGRTYHLTPEHPVPVSLICNVAERALSEYAKNSARTVAEDVAFEELQETFTSQMEVYRAYWRDDPKFDRTNIVAAAPQLACPDVDFDMLLRTSRYALQTNFGWPRPKAILPEFDVMNHLNRVLPIQSSCDGSQLDMMRIGLRVNGPGGGQWTVFVQNDGVPVAASLGIADGNVALRLNSKIFQQCAQGQLTVEQAAQRGWLMIEGNGVPRERLFQAMQTVMTFSAVFDPARSETTADSTRGSRVGSN